MANLVEIVKQLPLLVLISFDGFRHDYLDPKYAPNLYSLVPSSTRGNMESLYITKTFPNHFSMATGLYEDEHQIVNNNMFDPDLNATFKPGNFQSEWWNPSGTIMPIWIANQAIKPLSDPQAQRHSGVMMYPGSGAEYHGIFPTHYKDYDTVRNWTYNIETAISWLTHPKSPANLLLLYFEDPDRVAHSYGPWGKETLMAVRRVDSAAGYFVKRLREKGLFDETNILFVSDHGMAEVKTIIYLSDIFDTSKIKLYGASPNWSIFVKQEFAHEKSIIFEKLLVASRQNNFRIYKREDISQDFHYSKSKRIGDFLLVTQKGIDMYLDRSKDWYKSKIWGNHGWRPDDKDMRPLFLATGPSFKKNYVHPTTFPNIDLFPLMTFLLNLPSKSVPNNGSWARVAGMISHEYLQRFDDNISASCKYN